MLSCEAQISKAFCFSKSVNLLNKQDKCFRSEIKTAILFLRFLLSTKIANNIANKDLKMLLSIASDAGIYITPLN